MRVSAGLTSEYDATSGTASRTIVVMGVAASGKSTVATALAARMDLVFLDADWLHSSSNREKMARGEALSDDDRSPWLRAVGEELRDNEVTRGGSVVACSALKRLYRDLLRTYVPRTFFVFLDAEYDVLRERMQERGGGLLPVSLLASQFADLEPLADDEAGVRVDARERVDVIVARVLSTLAGTKP